MHRKKQGQKTGPPASEEHEQLLLFQPRQPRPLWKNLPAETKRKSLQLLVKLLRVSRVVCGKEAGHE